VCEKDQLMADKRLQSYAKKELKCALAKKWSANKIYNEKNKIKNLPLRATAVKNISRWHSN